MERGRYLIWTYMRCFDHDKEDFGIDDYLARMNRVPDGFNALVVHPDFVHRHPGMKSEVRLPPHLCGCRKDPRRLPPELYAKLSWTNYQIRGLVNALHARGIRIYLSLMGLYYEDLFHQEWMGEHKEVLFQASSRVEELNALKHLKDGTLFEDFFLEKLKETLLDYGFDGVHLCDRFSPLSEPLADGDFSTDMLLQFSGDTGIGIPPEIAVGLGDDSDTQKKERQRWLWGSHREAWIRFYDRRWTAFYRKLCAGLHGIGRKVSTLGMYVSDPLRSMYSMGIDIGHLADAGVDFFTPNILPTSVNMNGAERPPLFDRYMTYIPAIKAMAPEADMLLMLGVRDEEEEWDVLHHAPNAFERDLFTAMSYQIVTDNGPSRCIEKPFVTLGDSIEAKDWEIIHNCADPIFAAETKRVVSPLLYWSDEANTRMLGAHIATRRPSASKLQAVLQSHGAFCGGVVRKEALHLCKNPLFVPTFDLLSAEEQQLLFDSRRPILAIAPADYEMNSRDVTFRITDRFSSYPHTAYLMNCPPPADTAPYEALLSGDDGTPQLPPEEQLNDAVLNVMDDMHFQKVTMGFGKACAMLFTHMDLRDNLFSSEVGLMVFEERNSVYRVLAYNPEPLTYGNTLLRCKVPMKSVETLSSYPYRPVQFVDDPAFIAETRDMAKLLDSASGRAFQLRIRPSGVSVFRITIESEK